MAIEIEAKMRLGQARAPAADGVRDALSRSGAKRITQVMETNVFLDTPDHRLLASGSGLRLRRNRNVDTGRETLTLTYKGALLPGPLKSREEIEFGVDRFEETLQLLQR